MSEGWALPYMGTLPGEPSFTSTAPAAPDWSTQQIYLSLLDWEFDILAQTGRVTVFPIPSQIEGFWTGLMTSNNWPITWELALFM